MGSVALHGVQEPAERGLQSRRHRSEVPAQDAVERGAEHDRQGNQAAGGRHGERCHDAGIEQHARDQHEPDSTAVQSVAATPSSRSMSTEAIA